MYRCFFILLVLVASSIHAAEHYFSVIVKPTETNNLIIHAVSIGPLKIFSPKNIDEFFIESDEQSLIHLEAWMLAKMSSPKDTAVILYDSQTENYVKNLKYIKSWKLENVREIVLSTLHENGSDWEPSLNAKMQYLVHSHPIWQKDALNQFYVNAETVINLNFEQLRAYFWARGLIKTKSPKIHYWMSEFKGNALLTHLGHVLIDDSIFLIGTNGIPYQADKSDGVPIDMVSNADGSFTLHTLCTDEIQRSAFQHGVSESWHTMQDLLRARQELFQDFLLSKHT